MYDIKLQPTVISIWRTAHTRWSIVGNFVNEMLSLLHYLRSSTASVIYVTEQILIILKEWAIDIH